MNTLPRCRRLVLATTLVLLPCAMAAAAAEGEWSWAGKVYVAVPAGDLVEGAPGGSITKGVRLSIPCLSGCRYRFSLASETGTETNDAVLTNSGSDVPGLAIVNGKATYFGKATPAGTVQQFIYVRVLGDAEIEPDEKLQIRVEDLNQPKTADGYPSYLLFAGTIKNDDGVEDSLAAKGEALALQDPLVTELRNLQTEGPFRRGFDVGIAAWDGNTLQGPGKQALFASLASQEERTGFLAAEAFSMQRNPNIELAARGAAIARQDPAVARAREAEPDVYYKLGFDIATGIFGDPAQGALGNTLLGPGSLRIRDSLTAENAQWGFDAAATYHLGRKYH